MCRLLGGGDSIIAVTLAGVEADRGDQSDDAISVRADHGTAGTGHGVLSASSAISGEQLLAGGNTIVSVALDGTDV